jgi:nicotinate dehydrogenase subunit A
MATAVLNAFTRNNSTLEIRRMSQTDAVAKTIFFKINGETTTIQADDLAMPLLYALRNDLGLRGPRFGCGLAQCGACTVHLNGQAVRSCVVPLSAVAGKDIVTLEGLGTPQKPHPLKEAFIAEQAAQCGYCINGMIMQAASLLNKTPHPGVHEIKTALAGNLCRCGTHLRIVRAIQRAASAPGLRP